MSPQVFADAAERDVAHTERANDRGRWPRGSSRDNGANRETAYK
jgi:hypothetical protein